MVFLHTLTTLSDFALHLFFPTSDLTEDQTCPPLINTQCLTATSGHVRRQKPSSSKSVCDSESYLQPESEAGEDTIEMENILSDSSTGEVDKVQTYRLSTCVWGRWWGDTLVHVRPEVKHLDPLQFTHRPSFTRCTGFNHLTWFSHWYWQRR